MTTKYSTPEGALENILEERGPLTKHDMRAALAEHFPADRFEVAFLNLVQDTILVPHFHEAGGPSGKWKLA